MRPGMALLRCKFEPLRRLAGFLFLCMVEVEHQSQHILCLGMTPLRSQAVPLFRFRIIRYNAPAKVVANAY